MSAYGFTLFIFRMQLLPVNDNNNRPSEGDNYPLTPADSFDSLDDIEGKGNYLFEIMHTKMHPEIHF